MAFKIFKFVGRHVFKIFQSHGNVVFSIKMKKNHMYVKSRNGNPSTKDTRQIKASEYVLERNITLIK